jgi:hypothetical protein
MCRTATTQSRASDLKEGEEWIETFDLDAFTADIHALGKKLESEQGEDDVRHLNKIIGWSNLCATVGFMTMGHSVNLIAIVALSTWTFSRWTIIAHHTCHGGFQNCHPNLNRWSRFKFALGSLWRRMCDWFDWMMPE